MGWAIAVFAAVVVSLWGSALYGERSEAPLWRAGVVPMVVWGMLALVLFLVSTRGDWHDAFLIAGGYFVGLPLMLGGLCYAIARKGRGTRLPYLPEHVRARPIRQAIPTVIMPARTNTPHRPGVLVVLAFGATIAMAMLALTCSVITTPEHPVFGAAIVGKLLEPQLLPMAGAAGAVATIVWLLALKLPKYFPARELGGFAAGAVPGEFSAMDKVYGSGTALAYLLGGVLVALLFGIAWRRLGAHPSRKIRYMN